MWIENEEEGTNDQTNERPRHFFFFPEFIPILIPQHLPFSTHPILDATALNVFFKPEEMR